MLLRSAAVFCTFLTLGFGDTLTLRSGATIQGSFAGGDTRRVKMLVGDRLESYDVDNVVNLQFGTGRAGAGPSAALPAEENRSAGYETPRSNDGLRRERAYETTDSARSGLQVPAGTVLVVRMIDGVDSERDSMGQTFRASIDEPVVVNGVTVIPRGADVVTKLVAEKQSGKFEGRTALTLDVMQVMINGRMVDVNTTEVTQQSSSRGARTAKTVGGGAVAGAVLGGILGGGRGAAIGAASGGAVGAGADVITKGQRVRIPSETRLSFTLQQPVSA